MITVIVLLALLVAALAVCLMRRSRPAAMPPCVACGMAQVGVPQGTDGRCVTCQQRECLGDRATQAVRAIRAEADAAVWRA